MAHLSMDKEFMPNATFQEIASALDNAKSVLVASHMRPDGDALGSTIAFAKYLTSSGKSVEAWNEDGMPEKFSYLPGAEMVTPPPPGRRDFDVVVALDNANRKRLGTVLDSLGEAGLWINIDHHVSNECYGNLNHIDATAPATGQILFEFFDAIGAPLGEGIAENLFAAISTDTGSFQYSGTNGRTFRAASELVSAGVDVAALSQQIYDRQPRRRLELLRHALNTAEFHCDDRIATFSLSLADVKMLGIVPEDNEGIIDHLRSVDSVLAAVFFEELEDGKVRVSARSKDLRVDVCSLCAQFGGGGHPLAAGARVHGSLAEVKSTFTEKLSHEIRSRT